VLELNSCQREKLGRGLGMGHNIYLGGGVARGAREASVVVETGLSERRALIASARQDEEFCN
jgi:hypothetical protein